jgi:hypothetical protein
VPSAPARPRIRRPFGGRGKGNTERIQRREDGGGAADSAEMFEKTPPCRSGSDPGFHDLSAPPLPRRKIDTESAKAGPRRIFAHIIWKTPGGKGRARPFCQVVPQLHQRRFHL